jgi:diguanylate cyclase (GGDEF)-like protein
MDPRLEAGQSAPRGPVSRGAGHARAPESGLEALFESAPVGLALLDSESRFLFANAELGRLAGSAPATLVGLPIDEVAPELAGRGGLTRDGRSWILARFPVESPPGAVGIVAQEVTALKQVEQQLEELLCLEQSRSVEIEAQNDMLATIASTDALTGLANRRSFSDALDAAIARADNEGGEVAILYLDLDAFKPVNDVHGHETGDLVLVEVARRLREAARETDAVARLGGDEFLLLLGNLDAGGGREVAKLVRERLGRSLRRPVELDAGAVTVTASVGIAVYPHDARGPEALLAAADQAMYRCKRERRRRARRPAA